MTRLHREAFKWGWTLAEDRLRELRESLSYEAASKDERAAMERGWRAGKQALREALRRER